MQAELGRGERHATQGVSQPACPKGALSPSRKARAPRHGPSRSRDQRGVPGPRRAREAVRGTKWRRRESNPRPRTHRIRASTSLGCPLISPGRPECSRPTAGPAILWSRASGDWLSFGASPFLSPLTEPRAELGATRHLTRLGGECEVVVRTCVGFRCFTRPPEPRLAALPENRPRRDLVAPVCVGTV